MKHCPSDEQMARLLDELLADAERDAVESHLQECADCQARVEELLAAAAQSPYGPSDAATEDGISSFLTRLKESPPARGAGTDAAPEDAAGITPALALAERRAANALPALPEYEVVEELGRGGMGVVYKARHERLKRFVALKMVLGGQRATPRQKARFRSEAEAAARLQHSQIVQIFEIGEHDSCPYLCLEYVEGGSLAAKIAGSPQPAATAAGLVREIAAAVEHAHRRGIIHRDLKPSNILLSGDGVPKVADFGLAKRFGEDDVESMQDGPIAGTPSYMAPEQVKAAGEGPAVGPATDVYALGSILYELLTGRPPFRAATPLETVLQVQHDDPVSPRRLQPNLSRDLETICLQCLQKDPRQRYASAAALADDLGRFLAHQPVWARPIPPWGRAWRWCRREPRLAGAAGLAALALLAVALVSTVHAVSLARLNNQLSDLNGRLETTNTDLAGERDRVRQNARNAKQIRDALMAFVSKNRVALGTLDPERLALVLVEACRQAVEMGPDDPDALANLGDAYYALGVAYRDAKKHDKMKEAWIASGSVYDALRRYHDANPAGPDSLHTYYDDQLFARSIGALAQPTMERPGGRPAAFDLAAGDLAAANAGRTYYNLGVAAAERGNHSEVIDWQTRAIDRLEPVLSSPAGPQVRWFVCWAHVGRGTARLKLSQPAAALPDWERALALADNTDREMVRLYGLAYTLARLGERAKAATAARTALAALPHAPEHLLVAAKVFALNAGGADPDRADAAKAVEYLQEARKRGAFKTPAARQELTKTGGEFEALRNYGPFQAFLRELGSG